MQIALDTNILIPIVNESDPLRSSTIAAVQLLEESGWRSCTLPQNLVEYWAVCTKPITANGFGLTTLEAHAKLAAIEVAMDVLPETPTIFATWKDLVLRNNVLGKQVHDTRIAAALRVHAVPTLLTWNPRDFKRFPFLTCITPEQVLAGVLP